MYLERSCTQASNTPNREPELAKPQTSGHVHRIMRLGFRAPNYFRSMLWKCRASCFMSSRLHHFKGAGHPYTSKVPRIMQKIDPLSGIKAIIVGTLEVPRPTPTRSLALRVQVPKHELSTQNHNHDSVADS